MKDLISEFEFDALSVIRENYAIWLQHFFVYWGGGVHSKQFNVSGGSGKNVSNKENSPDPSVTL